MPDVVVACRTGHHYVADVAGVNATSVPVARLNVHHPVNCCDIQESERNKT